MDRGQTVMFLRELGYAQDKIDSVLQMTTEHEQAVNLAMSLYPLGGKEADEDDWVSDNDEPDTGDKPLALFVVVREDLKMSVGKMAAQVGHGVLGAVTAAKKQLPVTLSKWESSGETKLFFHVESEQRFLKIAGLAKSSKVPQIVISDAGRTQIAAGSKTVLAFGPRELISPNLRRSGTRCRSFPYLSENSTIWKTAFPSASEIKHKSLIQCVPLRSPGKRSSSLRVSA